MSVGGRETVVFILLVVLLMTSYASISFSDESGNVPEAGIRAGKGAVLFEDVAHAREILDIKHRTLDERDILELSSVKFEW